MSRKQPVAIIPGYRIVRTIGEGGMGMVYEAEHEVTGERFAVKVMRKHLADDETIRIRFRREIDALSAIRHPNVVNIFEWSDSADEAGAHPYIVMELLDGLSLADALRGHKRMRPAQAVRIMLQATEGLAAAHAKGVLHRDIGPSNVFLERRAAGGFRTKLLDFGLARPTALGEPGSSVTREGTVMGKPAYIAPEALLSQPLDERSDVFSLGMVLFRILAGQVPFTARDAEMLWVERWAERQRPGEYLSVRQFAPDVPEELAEVVARAVRRPRETRYESAKAMQQDLLRVHRGLAEEPDTDPDPHFDGLSIPSVASGILDGEALDLHLQASKSSPFPAADGGEASSSRIIGRATPVGRNAAPNRHRRAGIVAASAVLAVAVLLLVWVLARGSGTEGRPDAADGRTVSATGPRTDGADRHDAGVTGAVASNDAGVGTPGGDSLPTGALDDADEVSALVRLQFADLPPLAVVTVAGQQVDPAVGIELPRSREPVRVVVEVPGGRYDRHEEDVVPERDHVLRPTLRRTDADAAVTASGATPSPQTGPSGRSRDAGARSGSPPDAGGRTQGRFGTSFVTEWGEEEEP